MKCFQWLIAGVGIVTLTSSAQLAMTQGDSYVFRFEAMPEGSVVLGPHFQGGRFSLELNAGTVNGGDSLRMEMFEEDAVGTANAEQIVDLASGFTFLSSPDMWADRDGTIRVTAISGEFTIDKLIMQRGEPTNPPDPLGIRHQLDSITVTPVPEPSTLALVLLGAAAGGWRIWRRR